MDIVSELDWVDVNSGEQAQAQARAATLKGKSVLIYGMNYAPEMAGVGRYTGEIAELAAGQADAVTVVTTPPHYPGWKVQGDFKNAYSTAAEGKVTVKRVPLFLREKMGGIWRLIAPLSFAATSAPVVFWQIITRRPDVVMCVEPTLFAAPVALLAAKLVGARTVLHVQDLEVDAAFAVGHLKNAGWLKKLGGLYERVTLRRFDKIVTISTRMAEKLAEKTRQPDRLAIVRNWVDLEHLYPLDRASTYRETLGYSADDFVVLYSGNIGAKQGLDTLLEAAMALETNRKIRFVIAGEGPAKADLMARYSALTNVRFLPFQPYSELNEFLNLADLHALPQDRGAADLVLPSKLGGMLASGGQVVVTADPGTELADFLDGNAIVTPPGDAGALAEAIDQASRTGDDPVKREGRLSRARLLSKRDGFQAFLAVLAG